MAVFLLAVLLGALGAFLLAAFVALLATLACALISSSVALPVAATRRARRGRRPRGLVRGGRGLNRSSRPGMRPDPARPAVSPLAP